MERPSSRRTGRTKTSALTERPQLTRDKLDMKLSAVCRYALVLPEVTREPHPHFSSLRVRGKIFVTFPQDGEHIHVFVSEQDREQALALYPEAVEKLMWGGKVVGVRVALSVSSPAVVKELVRSAWEHKAPRALVLAARTRSGRRA